MSLRNKTIAVLLPGIREKEEESYSFWLNPSLDELVRRSTLHLNRITNQNLMLSSLFKIQKMHFYEK